jgi:putative membrane protein
MRHVVRPSILTLALPLSLGACSWLGIGGGSSDPAPKPASTTEAKPATKETAKAPAKASAKAPAPAPKPGSGLSDANIAAIVVAANNADILYADLALAKSQDTEIRAFATMVKKDHQSVNEAAVALVTRLKVKPVDNQISFDLRDDAETKRLMFRDLEGFAFDSAYAANEVSYHTTVLGAIDAALIPSAQNAELKTLLVEVRPAVQAHLDHARTLAASKTRRRR